MKHFFLNIHKDNTGAVITALIILFMLLAAGGLTYSYISGRLDDEPPASEEGSTEVRNYFGQGCWESDPIGVQSQFLNSGEVFTCAQTMTLTEIQLRAGRSNTGTNKWRAVIYTWDSVEEEVIESIGASVPFGQSDIEYWKLGTHPLEDLPNVYISFYDDDENKVVLLESVDYAYQIESYEGGSMNIYNEQIDPDASCSGDHLGSLRSSNYYDGDARDYWLTGYETQEPTCTTIGAEIRTDGSVWLSGWTDVFDTEQEVGFYVSEDEAVVTAGTGTRYDAGLVETADPRYYFMKRVVSILSDTTYYYRAYTSIDGQEYLGGVKSFERLAADMLPEIDATISVNSVDLIEFEVTLIGVPAETSWNITLFYGRTISDCYSQNYSIEVTTGVEDDGVWYVQESPETFDYGAKYFYYACAVEDLGTSVCSTLRNLIVYNPDQPAALNWIARTFNIDFTTIWWIIFAVGLILIWLIAGFTRWWWLGLIGTAILLIVLITFGFVNPWVVVTLVIIVGWIIFKIIFKRAGGTG